MNPNADQGGRRSKNPKKNLDIFNGCPLMAGSLRLKVHELMNRFETVLSQGLGTLQTIKGHLTCIRGYALFPEPIS